MVTGLYVDGRICDVTSPEGQQLILSRTPRPQLVVIREQNLEAIAVVAPIALSVAALYFLGVGITSLISGDFGVGIAALGPSAASFICAFWMWRTAQNASL